MSKSLQKQKKETDQIESLAKRRTVGRPVDCCESVSVRIHSFIHLYDMHFVGFVFIFANHTQIRKISVCAKCAINSPLFGDPMYTVLAE